MVVSGTTSRTVAVIPNRVVFRVLPTRSTVEIPVAAAYRESPTTSTLAPVAEATLEVLLQGVVVSASAEEVAALGVAEAALVVVVEVITVVEEGGKFLRRCLWLRKVLTLPQLFHIYSLLFLNTVI